MESSVFTSVLALSGPSPKTASPSIRLVSNSDKLHNARSILKDYRESGEATWLRFNGGRDGTLWYYRALVAVFSQFPPHPLADELKRTVSELERLAAAP